MPAFNSYDSDGEGDCNSSHIFYFSASPGQGLAYSNGAQNFFEELHKKVDPFSRFVTLPNDMAFWSGESGQAE